jgi:tRNA isopentenyl-2-thiomethyl-A-37 hydroxylase MiaE
MATMKIKNIKIVNVTASKQAVNRADAAQQRNIPITFFDVLNFL